MSEGFTVNLTDADWQAENAAFREMPKDEFCRRFKERMLKRAGEIFDDGTSVAEYAEETAPSYYEEIDQREEGPEECADADMSYWGD